ncbi:alpha/beta fold hydrolase [Volucribacter amazonae]|uniref:Phospholipase/carboxylesterase/thioesterase domain-containing protein n=1 Tax=Volucribacter amazonae TaxID=256731 RepID=A0A9X4PDA4_9PAST|nr:alpha/beta fold hydrolase [Volucribacter amazonae]MDG6895144.1 hypothetical protein [Volucribacter amazonae]
MPIPFCQCQPIASVKLLGAEVTAIQVDLQQPIPNFMPHKFQLFIKNPKLTEQWQPLDIECVKHHDRRFMLHIKSALHNPITKLYHFAPIDFCQQKCPLQFRLQHTKISPEQCIWLEIICPEQQAFHQYTFADFTYSLACPPHHQASSSPLHSLIVCLHGAGERGKQQQNILADKLATTFLDQQWQKAFNQPYILAPQCPSFWLKHFVWQQRTYQGERDYSEDLLALIEQLLQQYPNIDKQRIYLIGVSMGGYQALRLLAMQPNLFSAGIIACPAQILPTQQLAQIRAIPLCFLHSELDQVVPAQNTQQITTQLAKNNPIYTHYYQQIIIDKQAVEPHAVFLKLYQNEPHFDGQSVLDWLSLQRKTEKLDNI